jgi:hypothetical protein
MGRACTTRGEKMNAYRVLVGKSEGPLGRTRRRYEDNIIMDLREISWGYIDRINPAQGTSTSGGCCKYDNESSGSIEYFEILE